jgi:hypothetical protein
MCGQPYWYCPNWYFWRYTLHPGVSIPDHHLVKPYPKSGKNHLPANHLIIAAEFEKLRVIS